LNHFSTTESRNFQAKIKFISNIIISLTQNYFSVIQMQYLYKSLLIGVRTTNNQLFLLEIVKIITSLGTEINKKINIINTYIKSIEIIQKDFYELEFKFDNTYTEDEMINFISALSILLEVPEKSLKIISYKGGSTWLKVVITTSLTLSILLKSLNYFLPELTLTVKHSHELYKELKEFGKTIEIYQEKEAIMKSLEKVDTKTIDTILQNTRSNEFLLIEGKTSLTIS